MNLRRLSLAALVVYALLIFYSVVGQPPRIVSSFIAPLAGFVFAALHASAREGWKSALRLLALVFGVSLLFESVGVATGWVYGPYHYTDRLGPKFLGLVPYMIPTAWFMMSYPAFVIAEWLLAPAEPSAGRRRWQRILGVAAVGGLVMTAWDMIMDPIMVGFGHWVWDRNTLDAAYFGIPLQNFWGWWLTVFVTYLLYLLVRGPISSPPEAGFDRLALLSYLVTALGMIATALVNGWSNLALIGFFAMMPWVIMGWVRMTGGMRSSISQS